MSNGLLTVIVNYRQEKVQEQMRTMEWWTASAKSLRTRGEVYFPGLLVKLNCVQIWATVPWY